MKTSMEHRSNLVENEENGCQSILKEDDTCRKILVASSPKNARVPLLQLNNSVIASNQPHASIKPCSLYRYQSCTAIPEEGENQENVQHDIDTVCSTHKSESSCANKPTTSGASSPSGFAYPAILEGYQSSPSPTPLYKSPVAYSYHSHERSSNTFESPKTHLVTPYGKSTLGSHEEGSHEKGIRSENENNLGRMHRIRSNSGRHICNAKGPLSRGVLVSGHGCCSSSGSSLNSKSSVTPSKSISSERLVFRTPSDTCSSSVSESRLTPQQRYISYQQIRNPFEVGVDHLQLPTVSPSLFRQVVSPSQQCYENFTWSIDELALLRPVNIETSPYNQAECCSDPDYEQQAQAAIDKFFNKKQLVPSPWTGNDKSVGLMRMNLALDTPASCQPTPATRTISCQTELSLPLQLPEYVEELLKPFHTYTQECNDAEEGNNLSNTTLRRKLLFSQEELLNATPMCSPPGASSLESSASLSPVAAPLHDEDGDAASLWHTDVVELSGTGASLLDPSMKRSASPTSPILFEQIHFQGATFDAKEHSSVNSPPRRYAFLASPNLSPVEGQTCVNKLEQSILASPTVSPIKQDTESDIHSVMCSGATHTLEDEGDIHPIMCSSAISTVRLAENMHSQSEVIYHTTSPIETSPVSHTISHHDAIPKASSPLMSCQVKSDDIYGDPYSSRSPNELQNNGESDILMCHTSTEKTPSSDSENIDVIKAVWQSRSCSSGEHLEICRREGTPSTLSESVPRTNMEVDFVREAKLSPSNSVCTGTYIIAQNHTNANEKLSPSNSVCTGTYISAQNHTNANEMSFCNFPISSNNEEKTFSNTAVKCNQAKVTQNMPPSKSEERSSGSSSHFSSSPIRDTLRSPLTVNTPCKKLSVFPPLSPIFCRSILVNSQTDQTKMQIQRENNCRFTSDSLSQTAMFSVDMETQNTIEEEILMDEGVSVLTAAVDPSTPHSHRKHLIEAREISVCDMDTDFQQSLVNISPDMKSQESGYQTGSLQSTNFSLSTFTSNSTMGSSMSFPKDKCRNLFGSDVASSSSSTSSSTEKQRQQFGFNLAEHIE